MTSWHSYPKVYNLGHRALVDLFDGTVVAQEKVDGSQFSFGLIDGVLRFRSKGQEIFPDAVPALFRQAVESVQSRQHLLQDGLTYRGEYLQKPKHNVLAYDRTPGGHIIIFDINDDEESYLHPWEAQAEANRIGLEYIGTFAPFSGAWDRTEIARALERTSCLGGAKIEGLVFKNYTRFGPDKKVLMGRYVSEAFREIHGGEWRKSNPTQGDLTATLIAKYRTPARWKKAVQHLRDSGQLLGEPKDIGPLTREVSQDVLAEEKEAIQEALWKYFWPKIQRGVTAGLPEWYKDQLLDQQQYETAA